MPTPNNNQNAGSNNSQEVPPIGTSSWFSTADNPFTGVVPGDIVHTDSGASYIVGTKISKKPAAKKSAPKLDLPLVPLPNFKFGADPEGFLFDKQQDKFIPAAGIIPGNKHEPYTVDKGAVQVDGLAVEYNIDPVSTYEDWENHHTTVQAQLSAMLPEHIEVRWVPTVVFDEETFDKAPDESKILGCMPDFNAWSGESNPPPAFNENPTMRCGGGHIHIGWTNGEDLCDIQHAMNCRDLTMQLDWFLGGWASLIDKDVVRKQLYGNMGALRYKDYGLEYRVLSNFWVATPEYRRQVWDRLCAAIDYMSHLYIPDRTRKSHTELLQNLINYGKVDSNLLSKAQFPLQTLDTCYLRF